MQQVQQLEQQLLLVEKNYLEELHHWEHTWDRHTKGYWFAFSVLLIITSLIFLLVRACTDFFQIHPFLWLFFFSLGFVPFGLHLFYFATAWLEYCITRFHGTTRSRPSCFLSLAAYLCLPLRYCCIYVKCVSPPHGEELICTLEMILSQKEFQSLLLDMNAEVKENIIDDQPRDLLSSLREIQQKKDLLKCRAKQIEFSEYILRGIFPLPLASSVSQYAFG